MNGPLTVELAIDLNNAEITCHREAISQSAPDEDWQAAAIRFFGSLRQRRCRYQVRRLADESHSGPIEPRRSYNPVV
jgi:hypothetical protein